MIPVSPTKCKITSIYACTFSK